MYSRCNYFGAISFFVLLAVLFPICGHAAPVGDGFVLKHDEKQYGEFLVAKRLDHSLPTTAVTIHGNRLFAAGTGHVTVYDISNPLEPKQTARLFGIREGRQMQWYKGNLFITSRACGLYVIDVNDPDHPVLRTHYDTIELATGIKCVDDIAYVCQRQFGTEFIDISDPSNLKHIGFVLSGEAQSVDCANGILYAGDWGVAQLTVIDVRNPKNPTTLAHAPLDGLGDGVYVRGDYCYCATGIHRTKIANKIGIRPALGHGLDIFNVSKPNDPKLVGRIKLPPQAVHKSPDCWSVCVNESKMAYVADSFNGVFCIDVTDPAQPKSLAHSVLPLVKKTGNPDPVGGLAVGNGVIYAAGYTDGVYVIPAQQYAKPVTEKRTCPKPTDIPVPGPYVPDPNLVRDFFVVPTGGQTLAAAVMDDNTIWVAAGQAGLQRIDLSVNPPRVVSVQPTRGFAYDVKVFGDKLFAAEGANGMAIYRIIPSGELWPLGRFDPGYTVRQVAVPDPKRLAVAKAGNSQLHFLDITDESRPKVVLKDNSSKGILYGRDIVDGPLHNGMCVCVASGTGLMWFDCTGKIPSLKLISFGNVVSFSNGAFWYEDKLVYFRNRGFFVCDPGENRPFGEMKYHPIRTLTGFGKVTLNGKTVCHCDRRSGTITFIDLTELDKPKILRTYKTHAHPELAVYPGGRTVIPAGYAGLLIEKR